MSDYSLPRFAELYLQPFPTLINEANIQFVTNFLMSRGWDDVNPCEAFVQDVEKVFEMLSERLDS